MPIAISTAKPAPNPSISSPCLKSLKCFDFKALCPLTQVSMCCPPVCRRPSPRPIRPRLGAGARTARTHAQRSEHGEYGAEGGPCPRHVPEAMGRRRRWASADGSGQPTWSLSFGDPAGGATKPEARRRERSERRGLPGPGDGSLLAWGPGGDPPGSNAHKRQRSKAQLGQLTKTKRSAVESGGPSLEVFIIGKKSVEGMEGGSFTFHLRRY